MSQFLRFDAGDGTNGAGVKAPTVLGPLWGVQGALPAAFLASRRHHASWLVAAH